MGFKSRRYLPFLAVIIVLTACSVQKHFNTLSFFFDGVPNTEDGIENFVTDSLNSGTGDTLAISAQLEDPSSYIHQPYLKKQCASCHNQGQMGSMNSTQPALCYQCHTNLETAHQYEHGPAASGFCTECHDPHKSKNDHLLQRIGEDLCYRCHNATQVSESLFHNILEETTCTSCHHAHGSDNHSLLHQGTCYNCHDNFADLYAFTHGPVISGRCSECHASHRKGSEKLLIRSGQDLCFHCHDSQRILGGETHSYIDDANCTECHNPHGGEDRFMFK
ncbi:MAG: cytochrome c3 family protein [Bacteroidota bacterium]